MENLAAERAEVLRLALGVRALDPGDALGVVPATQEPFHRLRDALLPVLAESYGELRVVLSGQLGEMGAEKPLQRACAPRAVSARGCRFQGQRELVCHVWIDGPTVRAASLPLLSASITAATGVALG